MEYTKISLVKLRNYHKNNPDKPIPSVLNPTKNILQMFGRMPAGRKYINKPKAIEVA